MFQKGVGQAGRQLPPLEGDLEEVSQRALSSEMPDEHNASRNSLFDEEVSKAKTSEPGGPVHHSFGRITAETEFHESSTGGRGLDFPQGGRFVMADREGVCEAGDKHRKIGDPGVMFSDRTGNQPFGKVVGAFPEGCGGGSHLQVRGHKVTEVFVGGATVVEGDVVALRLIPRRQCNAREVGAWDKGCSTFVVKLPHHQVEQTLGEVEKAARSEETPFPSLGVMPEQLGNLLASWWVLEPLQEAVDAIGSVIDKHLNNRMVLEGLVGRAELHPMA